MKPGWGDIPSVSMLLDQHSVNHRFVKLFTIANWTAGEDD